MEVTKCDRCGAYVDKSVEQMPILVYGYSYEMCKRGDKVKKSLCYECYDKLEKWLDVNEEEKDANDD